jgi:hypothetical protein
MLYYAVAAPAGEEPVLIPGFDERTLATQPYELIHSDAWTGGPTRPSRP